MKKSIAIFGGSFSPPHLGHVLACKAFFKSTGAERVVVMPARRPPHKELDGNASDAQRFEMCELAFLSDSELFGKCEISDFELRREEKSYTVNTVEYFISQGYDDIYLFVGTDMLLTFESWHRFRDIFGYVTLCYMDRYGKESDNTEKCAQCYREKYGARILKIQAPVFEISSSEIRKIISGGESADKLLPEKVIRYIEENGLYKPD